MPTGNIHTLLSRPISPDRPKVPSREQARSETRDRRPWDGASRLDSLRPSQSQDQGKSPKAKGPAWSSQAHPGCIRAMPSSLACPCEIAYHPLFLLTPPPPPPGPPNTYVLKLPLKSTTTETRRDMPFPHFPASHPSSLLATRASL